MKYFIGIDIGGTKCAVSVSRQNSSEIISKISFPTNQPRGWKKIVDEIISSIEDLLKKIDIKPSDVFSGGISCGGPLDSKKGIIMSPPNLPDWNNIEICRIINERFGFPVYLQNDANACAVAEWKFGAGKGYGNMIFLTFGTGMGAGLILNGQLYSGANDMAGEVGHIRVENDGPEGYGKSGSFEGFCSGGGIARLGKRMAYEWNESGRKSLLFTDKSEIEKLTAKSVAGAAFKNDELALRIYSVCGEKLGKGLAILVDILNPECIVIGSIYARSEKLLKDSMLKALKEEALPQSLRNLKIVPSGLGENIGDYAAIGVAINGYESEKNNDYNS